MFVGCDVIVLVIVGRGALELPMLPNGFSRFALVCSGVVWWYPVVCMV